MEIQFVKIDATQNMTLLVESSVPRPLHQQVATELMAYQSVYAEQVGFIEPATKSGAWARLQMMGGEFCGNATMALAALLAFRRELPPGTLQVPLEVSGAPDILPCAIRAEADHFRGTVAMPPPTGIERRTLPLDDTAYEADVVHIPGIAHILLPAAGLPEDIRAFAERALPIWSALFQEDACGLMLCDDACAHIDPLVYVKSTASAVWERGCGSGSAAVGAYLAHRAGASLRADVAQPGGVITVDATCSDGAVTGVTITGRVRIVAQGTAYL